MATINEKTNYSVSEKTAKAMELKKESERLVSELYKLLEDVHGSMPFDLEQRVLDISLTCHDVVLDVVQENIFKADCVEI